MASNGGPKGGPGAGYLSFLESLGEYPGPESGAAAKAFEVCWLWSHGVQSSRGGGNRVLAIPISAGVEASFGSFGTLSSAAAIGSCTETPEVGDE